MALAQVVRFQFLAQVEVDVRVAVAPAVQLRDQPARAEGRRVATRSTSVSPP